MEKELWIVGQSLNGEDAWEFGGVFDSKEKAVSACRDENYFIGPAELNQQFPHEAIEWEKAFYPLRGDKK